MGRVAPGAQYLVLVKHLDFLEIVCETDNGELSAAVRRDDYPVVPTDAD